MKQDLEEEFIIKEDNRLTAKEESMQFAKMERRKTMVDFMSGGGEEIISNNNDKK